MRSIWKGTISFGLVNIPIGLYSATRSEGFKFKFLRKSDLSPVNYKRVAEADGKEVPWENIVRGYEYEKGKFVVLKEEDFQRVDIEATQTVDIMNFVDLEEINPMFFQKPYYMEPQKKSDKAYGLLRDALKTTGKVGIAKVVIKARQYLAAVKAQDPFLLLELMHFADELVDPAQLHPPKDVKPSKQEVAMATELIKSMTTKWDPEQYRDEYREALLKVIEEKIEHGDKKLPPKKGPAKRPSNVIDLVEVLQQSLAESKSGGKKQVAKKAKQKKAA